MHRTALPKSWILISIPALALGFAGHALAQAPSKNEAREALRKAVTFFSTEVSAHGGYLWRYSADLKYRAGENAAEPLTVWVQPPGTPTVGEALLDAWLRTGEDVCREAVVAAGRALVQGQLESGGWTYRIEFDPKKRNNYAYRVPPNKPDGMNVTTLDDDTTQAAVRFLMRLDKALDFKDAEIHACVLSALEALLAAQYPNGAWPQRFSGPTDPAKHPVKQASYPETWSRTFPGVDYMGYYTFNDNALADVIDTMFLATEIYGDGKYADAAKRGGDFILLAQMPDPQPGWAQQYDLDMHPAWARKFEPASITGGESQGVMRMLIDLYHRTGDEKYLEPLPRALAYYKSSLRPDGRLARFYELKTNTPLYFTLDYELTYSDADMPTHYAFIIGSDLDQIEAAYERARAEGPKPPTRDGVRKASAADVREAMEGLDARGAWVTEGVVEGVANLGKIPSIDCRTFIQRLNTLSAFIGAEN